MGLVQEITGNNNIANADSDTGAFGASVGAGHCLVLLVWGWRSAAAFNMASGGVSDNINGSWGAPVRQSTAQSNVKTAIFRFFNSGSGSITITVNPDSTNNYFAWWAGEYDDMGTTDPVDVSNANNAGGNNASGNTGATGTLAQADERVFSVVSVVNDPSTIAVTGSFVEEEEQLDGASFQAGEADTLVVSATTSVTCTWNFNPNNSYTASIAAMKISAGGTTLTPAAIAVPMAIAAPALALVLAAAAVAVQVVTAAPTVALTLAPAPVNSTIAVVQPTLALGLAPSPVTVPVAVAAPALALVTSPAAVAIPLEIGAATVTVGGAVTLKPDPIAIPLALPAPSLALLLGPAPVPSPVVVVTPAVTLAVMPSPVGIPTLVVAATLGLVTTPDPVTMLLVVPGVTIPGMVVLGPGMVHGGPQRIGALTSGPQLVGALMGGPQVGNVHGGPAQS